jgi:molybdopterin-guanine dinucleotide biosynthesis protein A
VTGAPARTSAIVLAGGRSSRFGSDKLAESLDGVPLLHHAVRAVASTCDEIILVLARDGPMPDLPTGLGATTRAVRDDHEHPGPLAALLVGARDASAARLLVVGGDMPSLRPAVLDRLLRWSRGQGASLVTGGESQVLPLALDRAATIAEADRLLRAGERALRALLTALELEPVPEAEWHALDPDGATLRDVDLPGDLRRAP